MGRPKTIIIHPANANEEWRPVYGFENEYSVSNIGNVRRDGQKRARSTFPGRPLKPNLAGIGYYTVALHGKTTCVHRLVAEAFLDPSKRHLNVNHKNGIRTDNRVENLEFVTHAENMAHAAGMLKKCGTRKLDDNKVRDIRRRFANGATKTELAREHVVAVSTICMVVNNVWWKHVDPNFFSQARIQ